jgi:hypothetical protein
MASSGLTGSCPYLGSGLSYRKTLGLQDWRIYCKVSLGNFATKNERLGLVLSRTQTTGVLVPINSAGSERRRKVRVS